MSNDLTAVKAMIVDALEKSKMSDEPVLYFEADERPGEEAPAMITCGAEDWTAMPFDADKLASVVDAHYRAPQSGNGFEPLMLVAEAAVRIAELETRLARQMDENRACRECIEELNEYLSNTVSTPAPSTVCPKCEKRKEFHEWASEKARERIAARNAARATMTTYPAQSPATLDTAAPPSYAPLTVALTLHTKDGELKAISHESDGVTHVTPVSMLTGAGRPNE